MRTTSAMSIGWASAKTTRVLVALQLGVTASGWAQRGVEALFPPRPTGYVTDVAAVVDGESARAITATIERLRSATGAEIAVVTLPTIGDRAAVDVAVAIGRAWGVGAAAEVGDSRRNAGVVILLVPRRAGDPNSGQVFIATGRGVEGIVTDAEAGRVRDLMRPSFQAGEYGEGLRIGVDVLAATIAEGMGVADSALSAGGRAVHRRRGGPGPWVLLLVFVVIAVVMVVFVAATTRSGRRPPPRRGGKRGRRKDIFFGGPGWGGGFGGWGGGFGGGGFGGFGSGGGFGGFGGGGGFSGGGAGGRF